MQNGGSTFDCQNTIKDEPRSQIRLLKCLQSIIFAVAGFGKHTLVFQSFERGRWERRKIQGMTCRSMNHRVWHMSPLLLIDSWMRTVHRLPEVSKKNKSDTTRTLFTGATTIISTQLTLFGLPDQQLIHCYTQHYYDSSAGYVGKHIRFLMMALRKSQLCLVQPFEEHYTECGFDVFLLFWCRSGSSVEPSITLFSAL